MDNKYFHVVSTLNQTLNSLKNQIYKNFFVVLTNFFHTDKIFSVFLLDMRFDFDFSRHLSLIIAAFENIEK